MDGNGCTDIINSRAKIFSLGEVLGVARKGALGVYLWLLVGVKINIGSKKISWRYSKRFIF